MVGWGGGRVALCASGEGVWVAFPNGTTCTNYVSAPINDQTLCYDSINGWQSFHSGSFMSPSLGGIPCSQMPALTGDTTTTIGTCATTTVATHLSSPLPIAQGGTGNTLSPVFVLCKAVGNPTVSISNSTVKTAILTCSVPGNTLGVNGMLRWTIDGSYLNNAGASKSFSLDVELGAATVISETNNITNGAGPTPLPFEIRGILANSGATNIQSAHMVWDQSPVPQAAGGMPALGNDTVSMGWNSGLTVDTTATQSLTINVQFQTNTATQTMNVFSAMVEILTP